MECLNLINDIKAYAVAENVPIMMPDSVNLLQCMVACRRPLRILEIGTAIGYSGIMMLSAFEGSHLYTVEIDEDSIAVAKENFKKAGLIDRVTFWTGDAEEIIPYLTGVFDFILLDGPKGHYNEFLPYLKQIMTSGSVLFADNVLFKGMTLKEGKTIHKHRTIITSLRSFLNDLETDESFFSTLIETGDGVSISVKK